MWSEVARKRREGGREEGMKGREGCGGRGRGREGGRKG